VIDADQLRAAMKEEIDLAVESGLPLSRSISAFFLHTFEPWLEDDATATELGRRQMKECEEGLGTNLYLANTIGWWAVSLRDAGRPKEALEAVARGREIMEPGDVADEIILDLAEAHALAALGRVTEALNLIGTARARAETTDSATDREQVDYIEARVRAVAGETTHARSLLESLVDRSAARGFHRYADRYRLELGRLP
jgi:ATP/maltotriose-dependent transcriptional regulator MalT